MPGAPSAVRDRFARLAARDDADLDVEEGALLIAAEEYPELDPDTVRVQLDDLGDVARQAIVDLDPAARIDRLNGLLFEEYGFGAATNYYDPRNSYLNEVLARRLGIPITLSLVYIGVGRRAGMDLCGVSFPGHFLVKCRGDEDRIVDAFHGCTLSVRDCEERLATALGPSAVLEPRLHLRDASAREILVRMLSNLQRIFAEQGDAERLLACCDRIVLLTPDSALALRDRALVYQRMGWLAAAVSDLDAALLRTDDAEFARMLVGRRDVLRQRMGPLN